jgi:hypothetical protein
MHRNADFIWRNDRGNCCQKMMFDQYADRSPQTQLSLIEQGTYQDNNRKILREKKTLLANKIRKPAKEELPLAIKHLFCGKYDKNWQETSRIWMTAGEDR